MEDCVCGSETKLLDMKFANDLAVPNAGLQPSSISVMTGAKHTPVDLHSGEDGLFSSVLDYIYT